MFLLARELRISYINVQMQRTLCPKVLCEWWESGPPVMNGPRVILAGTMNNAPSLHMSSCCHVLFFSHVIGNVFPNEWYVSPQTQKLI